MYTAAWERELAAIELVEIVREINPLLNDKQLRISDFEKALTKWVTHEAKFITFEESETC